LGISSDERGHIAVNYGSRCVKSLSACIASCLLPNTDMSPRCDVAWMEQGADECPLEYDRDMSVRQHLQLQLQVANRIRWLLMIVLAAVLVWLFPEHSLSVFKRLWMFGAFLLYFWFLGAVVGTLLDVPLARPRCPRCASKLAVGPRVTFCCQSCGISLDAKVQRNWPYTSITRTLWPMHSPGFRRGYSGSP